MYVGLPDLWMSGDIVQIHCYHNTLLTCGVTIEIIASNISVLLGFLCQNFRPDSAYTTQYLGSNSTSVEMR